MADANSIEVKISADASGFRAGAREAEAHSESLRSKLIELKGEHVQSARVARFYANEIADIVPGADAARESLQALVKVGLAEGAFGVAIASIGLLVAGFHEVSEAIGEADKHARVMQEGFKTAAEAVGEALKKVRESFEPPKSQTQAAWEAAAHAQREHIKEIQKEIDKLVAKGPGVKDFMSFLFHSDDKNQQLPIENRIKELQAEQAAIIAGIESRRPEKAATAEQERRENHKQALAEMAIDDATWLGENLRAEKKHNDQITAETTKFLEERFAAEEKEALDEARLLADETKEYKKHYDQVTADTTATLEEMFRREEAEAKKLAHELGQAAKEMGDAMGRNLADVLKGTKSIEDALADMLATLIKVATQMALMSALSAGGPGGALVGGLIGTVGGAIGGLLGGGGGGSTTNNININGSGLSARQMQTAVVNALRDAQRRGRF